MKSDILLFLKEWLVEHIVQTDGAFGDYLKTPGRLNFTPLSGRMIRSLFRLDILTRFPLNIVQGAERLNRESRAIRERSRRCNR